MNKKIMLIIILTTLVLSSCGVLPIGSNSDLSGTAWTLVSLNGNDLIPGSAMTAFFESGSVSGSASCNHYFGGYKIKGDQIEIEGLGWTEMACMDPEGIMEQEQQVMSLLSRAVTYSIQGQVLQIISDTGEVLVFQQVDNLD